MTLSNLKTYILILSLTVVLVALSAIPVMIVSVLCFAITAAFLAYSITKFTPKFIVFHACLILALNTIFLGSLPGSFIATIPVLLCGLVMGICYNLEQSSAKLLCSSTLAYVTSTVLNIKYIGPTESGKTVLEDAIAFSGQIYKESLMAIPSSELTADELNHIVSELTSALLALCPGFMVIACALMALLSYYAFSRILSFRHEDMKNLNDFSTWRAEKSVSIISFILIGVCMIFPANAWMSTILLNMTMVMSFVFFIFGLSFTDYKLKNRISSVTLRRLILCGITLLSFSFAGMPFLILSTCGMLDGLLDYRNRKKHF